MPLFEKPGGRTNFFLGPDSDVAPREVARSSTGSASLTTKPNVEANVSSPTVIGLGTIGPQRAFTNDYRLKMRS